MSRTSSLVFDLAERSLFTRKTRPREYEQTFSLFIVGISLAGKWAIQFSDASIRMRETVTHTSLV